VEPNKCCALKIGSGVCDSFPAAVHRKRFDTVLYLDAMIKAKHLWKQVVNAFFFSPPCDVLLSGMEKHSSSVS
jgi:hypothetical protein